MPCPVCKGRTKLPIVLRGGNTAAGLGEDYDPDIHDYISFSSLLDRAGLHQRIINGFRHFDYYNPYIKRSIVVRGNIGWVCNTCFTAEANITSLHPNIWTCSNCYGVYNNTPELIYDSRYLKEDKKNAYKTFCTQCAPAMIDTCYHCEEKSLMSSLTRMHAFVDKATRLRRTGKICQLCIAISDRLIFGKKKVVYCSRCNYYHILKYDPLCTPNRTGRPLQRLYVTQPTSGGVIRRRGENQFGKYRQQMMNYSYKPEYIIRRLPGEYYDSPTLGMEIEMGTRGPVKDLLQVVGDSYNQDWFYCKPDASITGDATLASGLELVSHPMSFAYWQTQFPKLKKLFRSLIKAGGRSYNTTSCGIHIHMSRPSFTKTQIYNLHQLVHRELVFSKFISQRSQNAMRWCSLDIEEKEVWIRKAKDLNAHHQRYVALNTSKHTIEFRLFKGSLRPSTVFKNLEVAQAYYEFSRQSMADMTALQFLDFLQDNRKKFPNLLSFIIHGVGRLKDKGVPHIHSRVLELKEVNECA